MSTKAQIRTGYFFGLIVGVVVGLGGGVLVEKATHLHVRRDAYEEGYMKMVTEAQTAALKCKDENQKDDTKCDALIRFYFHHEMGVDLIALNNIKG